MELVDELMTPGCPQCAVKHLCAALSYVADRNTGDEQMGNEFVLAARALINIAEADVGYKSHRDFAIGLLERAERETHVVFPGRAEFALRARALRLAMIADDFGLEFDARRELHALIHPTSYMWAHLVEAARELPSMHIPTGDPSYETIAAALAEVRREYFITDQEAPADSENGAEKGGETDMATKKPAKKAPAFLKKEDPKAKKAACKGGKTACKKGKCK